MRVRHHEGRVYLDTGAVAEEITQVVYEIDSAQGAERDGDPWAVVAVERAEQRLAEMIRPTVRDPRALAEALIRAADEADRHKAEQAAAREARLAAVPGPPSDYRSSRWD